MSFLLHDSLSETESTEISAINRVNSGKHKGSSRPRVTIIEEKLRVPEFENIVSRPRLLDLLERSIDHYGATMISGRAGTGKTVLAADFASGRKSVSWYSIEPADSDWREFSASFSASLVGPRRFKSRTVPGPPNESAISEYLSKCFSRPKKGEDISPRLIVLDNVHHLFDAEWFPDLFKMLVTSLAADTRLLMLCRSKPSMPLWRLRSKQMLNLIDEAMLDLTAEEAGHIYAAHGLPELGSREVLRRSFGRVSTFLKTIKEEAR
jgi:LuxR family maltose regulon positive regulatory protein